MAGKRSKRSPRKIKSLSTRKASAKEASRVRGGYIGETEKLKVLGSRDGTSNT
jgi:hypothetical protein